MKKLLLFSVVLGFTFLLAHCGQVCLGGVAGKCDSQQPPPPDNNFSITPQVAGVYRTTIRIGEVMTLKVAGGRKPYYPTPTDPPGCADVNNANYVVVPQYPGSCTIKLVDSSTPSLNATQTITILPRQ